MKKAEKLLQLSDAKLDKAVKIANTDLDRHCKLTSKEVKLANKLVAKGNKISDVAKQLGVSASAVRYRTDEAFRKEQNANRKNYINNRVTVCDFADRVAYKRALLKEGKVK